jgi:enoyl-CoA hydratase/carnithine racemase
MVVAADTALFALPEVRLGLVPGAGGAFRLGRQMPFRAAMGHVLTGRSMTAATALRRRSSADAVKGSFAFAEKRPPVWRGR